MSYLNTNGLVNGNIPKGQPCPFLAECKFRVDNCPSAEKPNTEHDYSCAAARFHSMLKKKE